MRGLKPAGRLRTCQPMSWKTRCTVFFVEVQQMRHRPVSKRRVLIHQGLDGFDKLLLQLGLLLRGLAVDRAPGNAKPFAQPDQTDLHAFFFQSLLKAQEHFPSSLPSREASFFLAFLRATPASLRRTPPADQPAGAHNVPRCPGAWRAFSMPFLASSTHSSSYEGGRTKDRLASATAVLP